MTKMTGKNGGKILAIQKREQR